MGAIIYVVSPNDVIKDRHDSFHGYADDCLIMRMALAPLGAATASDDVKQFTARFPEFFGDLDKGLAICQKTLGDLYVWLQSRVEGLRALGYKGKTIAQYLDDDEAAELLYEDGLAFRTEYDVDEDKLGDSFKKASTVIDSLRRKHDELAKR